MLRSLNEIRGAFLKTKDGFQGRVNDFYFHDWNWMVRYLVADTKTWLPGRLVLISPAAFKPLDDNGPMTNIFPLNLTKRQIEDSPSIDEEGPLSREQETALFDYYRWVPYWLEPAAGTSMVGAALGPEGIVAYQQAKRRPSPPAAKKNEHLRSVKTVMGYRIHANDGDIGHIDDFLVDDDKWIIRYAVVDTRNWLPDKRVVVSTEWIEAIDWALSKAFVPFLTRTQIRNSPPYDPKGNLSQTFAKNFHSDKKDLR